MPGTESDYMPGSEREPESESTAAVSKQAVMSESSESSQPPESSAAAPTRIKLIEAATPPPTPFLSPTGGITIAEQWEIFAALAEELEDGEEWQSVPGCDSDIPCA
jgi:hypothetical protein